ncbi:MAG: UDP-N-acetylmuramoyl-L-alanine--D-glutamate ligase [bacterium]|nr:UDP-N-acetylmuramoyl-L-alanine--D-glutamate ligase [bacterium]
MRLDELAGKDVAIWGLGREGRAVLELLRRRLPELRLTVVNDAPLETEVRSSLPEDGSVRLLTGPEAPDALPRFEVVIKSPGISPYRREVTAARAQGVIFTSATQIWFAEHPEARTVCVTGTKGKSTTASLVAHLLKASGIAAELRGNIGRPVLDSTPVASSAVWVIEVSSYQAADLEVSPDVAVLLNLFPEHLDWHGDVATYYRDKLRLFAGPRHAVINRSDEVSAGFTSVFTHPVYFNDPDGFHVAGGFVCERRRRLLPVTRIPLPGEHNHSNVCAALTAVGCLGIDAAAGVDAVTSFRGLPHRLFALGEKAGVLYVDDSISTTPQSARAAVETFADRPLSILLGGYERNIPYEELGGFLASKPVAAVITMPQNGPRIAEAVREAKRRADRGERPEVLEAESLTQAVELARQVTPAGGVVVLSPAAPSFGCFRDYRERGEAFARAAGFRIDEPGT